MMISKILRVGVGVAVALMVSSVATATPLNLTTAGTFGFRDGALFIQGGDGSGTGNFPAFVQITNNDDVHDAYNTTDNDTMDNGASDQFNHAIRLSDVSTITLGSTSFYVFVLDINEDNDAAGDKYLSLDDIIVSTSTTPNQGVQDPALLINNTVRFNLSADNPIGLNFDLMPGGGWGDMAMLIPTSFFTGALQTDYVYLYSKFGSLGINPASLPAGNYFASDGPEEWALAVTAPSITNFCVTNPNEPTCQEIPEVPEPATLALLGSGLAAMAFGLRKRAAKS